jgi:hypothetical protein
MPIYICRQCGQRLTAEISPIPLPPPVVEEAPGASQFLPPRIPQGAYAQSEELGGLKPTPMTLWESDCIPILAGETDAVGSTDSTDRTWFVTAVVPRSPSGSPTVGRSNKSRSSPEQLRVGSCGILETCRSQLAA